MTGSAHDLVVLAGGAGRRMGGSDKAEIVVGGMRLLDRVLAAVPGAGKTVVVGPVRPTGLPVVWCREEPRGGGPVAALAAALPLLGAPYVVVLAVDLPMVDADVVTRLIRAAVGRDGAVGVDQLGRDQMLLAAYDVAALRAAIDALGQPSGAAMHALVQRLEVVRVEVGDAAMDCDTWADVAEARAAARLARGDPAPIGPARGGPVPNDGSMP